MLESKTEEYIAFEKSVFNIGSYIFKILLYVGYNLYICFNNINLN